MLAWGLADNCQFKAEFRHKRGQAQQQLHGPQLSPLLKWGNETTGARPSLGNVSRAPLLSACEATPSILQVLSLQGFVTKLLGWGRILCPKSCRWRAAKGSINLQTPEDQGEKEIAYALGTDTVGGGLWKHPASPTSKVPPYEDKVKKSPRSEASSWREATVEELIADQHLWVPVYLGSTRLTVNKWL